MRLVTNIFPCNIELVEGYVYSLVIENPIAMRKFIENVVSQMNGNEGDIILSEDNKEIKVSQYVELISEYIPFEINNRKILAKIASILEEESVSAEYYHRTKEILADIERHIDNLSNILPCEIEYENLTPATLIKTAGIRVCSNSKTYLETIIDYMELMRDIDKKEKLFILLNARCFFDENELSDFFETCVAHKFIVLCVDCLDYKRLNFEKRIIVDKDLCVI